MLSEGKNQEFFDNMKNFHICRIKIGSLWNNVSTGVVESIQSVDHTLSTDGGYDASARQVRLGDGHVVQTFPELYEAANVARESFISLLNSITFTAGIPFSNVNVAASKSLVRATEKAKDDYGDRPHGPGLSWLFDIVRGSVECSSDEEIVRLVNALKEASNNSSGGFAPAFRFNIVDARILRIKNRFTTSTPGGFRDIMINIRIKIGDTDAGSPIYHTCELQVHLRTIKELGKELHSHRVYDFFRKFFNGNVSAVERRMMLMDHIAANMQDVNAEVTDEASTTISSDLHLNLKEIVERSVSNGALDASDAFRLDAWSQILDLMNEVHLSAMYQRIILGLKSIVLGPSDPEVLKEQIRYAFNIKHEGRYTEAKEIFENIQPRYAALYGTGSVEYLNLLGFIAGVWDDLGDFQTAADLYLLSLEGIKLLAADNKLLDECVLDTTHDLAMNKFSLGELEEARGLFNEVISGYTHVLGPTHPSTLRAMDNLAILLSKTRDYAEADRLYRQAVTGYEKEFGPLSTTTLRVMNNYGSFLREYPSDGDSVERSNVERSIEVLTRALAGYEQTLPPDHTEVLMVVSNLANSYADIRRNEEAKVMFDRVIQGREKLFGDRHAATLRAYLNLGAFLGNIGDYNGAVVYYDKVLRGRLEVLGELHVDTLNTMFNMGVLYGKMSQLELAAPLFERCVAGRTQLFGPSHTMTCQALNSLGNNCCGLGNYTRARDCFEQAYQGYLAANNGVENQQSKLNKARHTAMVYYLANEERKASLPLHINPATGKHDGAFHHEHTLLLQEAAYNGHYCCDVCNLNGYGWVYCCSTCHDGFDVHPQCCLIQPKEN